MIKIKFGVQTFINQEKIQIKGPSNQGAKLRKMQPELTLEEQIQFAEKFVLFFFFLMAVIGVECNTKKYLSILSATWGDFLSDSLQK